MWEHDTWVVLENDTEIMILLRRAMKTSQLEGPIKIDNTQMMEHSHTRRHT